ncbi:MAG TPA: FixH family protein [Caulobacteraceae bacterium]
MTVVENTVAGTRPHFVLKGWHVLIGFLLFFGVDIAVNTVFMVSAYRTFPGETSMTPYEDGVAYNKALQQRRDQEALGWGITADGSASGRLQVQASDRTGLPLRHLHISGLLRRPATENGAKVVTFDEASPGLYTASAGRLSGAWDLGLTIHDEHAHKAVAEHRLVLP